ncbi:hypothetical protein P9112_006367 [Eukaryota sp. TZLM1-RC]
MPRLPSLLHQNSPLTQNPRPSFSRRTRSRLLPKPTSQLDSLQHSFNQTLSRCSNTRPPSGSYLEKYKVICQEDLSLEGIPGSFVMSSSRKSKDLSKSRISEAQSHPVNTVNEILNSSRDVTRQYTSRPRTSSSCCHRLHRWELKSKVSTPETRSLSSRVISSRGLKTGNRSRHGLVMKCSQSETQLTTIGNEMNELSDIGLVEQSDLIDQHDLIKHSIDEEVRELNTNNQSKSTNQSSSAKKPPETGQFDNPDENLDSDGIRTKSSIDCHSGPFNQSNSTNQSNPKTHCSSPTPSPNPQSNDCPTENLDPVAVEGDSIEGGLVADDPADHNSQSISQSNSSNVDLDDVSVTSYVDDSEVCTIQDSNPNPKFSDGIQDSPVDVEQDDSLEGGKDQSNMIDSVYESLQVVHEEYPSIESENQSIDQSKTADYDLDDDFKAVNESENQSNDQSKTTDYDLDDDFEAVNESENQSNDQSKTTDYDLDDDFEAVNESENQSNDQSKTTDYDLDDDFEAVNESENQSIDQSKTADYDLDDDFEAVNESENQSIDQSKTADYDLDDDFEAVNESENQSIDQSKTADYDLDDDFEAVNESENQSIDQSKTADYDLDDDFEFLSDD